jgi:beta-N-acetylhexosaminidase
MWVGLDAAAGRTSLDAMLDTQHIGGVVLLGGWSDPTDATSTTAHLQSLVSEQSTSGLGLFISADQEGGAVQQMRGSGFTRIPSALTQGSMPSAQLTAAAKTWARQLARVGVNVNLAPVADTVPAALGTGNDPIGRWGRQFSSDPDVNAAHVAAVVTGMHQGGIAATVKHFPGLGRVRANTDFSATGITDSVTTTKDPYLAPFASGIRAGADFVMVSSAYYSRIDAANQALFSRAVVTTLLRTAMAYDGVVVTDDVGNARAVSGVPTGQRATRFLGAGGDIVLTGSPSSVPTMTREVIAKSAADPTFKAMVDAAVTRVVELKVRRGLARCP